MKKMCLFVIVTSLLTDVKCDLRTEYYQNLINQRTAEAEVYEVPQSNREFKAGVDSTDIIDIGNYDFIIVGSGAAGSVLAIRLSEINHWRILLLEAGDEEDDFSAIPNMAFYLQFSEKNWGYYSTPQTTCCLGMRGKRCIAPRGKSLGGSTAINGMIYVRGNHKDTERWVELGNPGWSYEEVQPYYIKSENSQIYGDGGYHGKGGFWNVEYSLPPTKATFTLLESNLELNVSGLDYNGAKQLGMSKIQVNTRHGRRQSTATAFLDNARKRKSLTLITKALVTKINIDKSTKFTQGVTFVKDGVKYTANARKEVIVSGGAFNSPQLLMLSGIGPKNHLEELGIEVIQDLPVGKNLQEHPLFLGLIFRTNLTTENQDMESQIKQYLDGYGPLTYPGNMDVLGFMHNGNFPKTVPMLEYILISPGNSNTSSILARAYNWDEVLVNQYLSKVDPRKDIMVFLILLHGKSRGGVTLQSNNPIDFPNIDLNLFSVPEDIDYMIDGIEFVLQLTETEAFRKINVSLLEIPICGEFKKYSKQFWECAVRHMSMTVYHPHGTTPMGPNATTAVVDTNLQVHGIEHLRVVDAGVIPTTVSGHTASPVVMIAEKISDVIKKMYNK